MGRRKKEYKKFKILNESDNSFDKCIALCKVALAYYTTATDTMLYIKSNKKEIFKMTTQCFSEIFSKIENYNLNNVKNHPSFYIQIKKKCIHLKENTSFFEDNNSEINKIIDKHWKKVEKRKCKKWEH